MENIKVNLNKKVKLIAIFILMLTLGGINTANAQRKYEISAQIKDEQTHKPLEFCTVKILTMQDSLLGGASTNAKGYFVTLLPRGKYKISVEYIGYKEYSTELTVVNKNLFLGTINMPVATNDLSEIAVKAAASENKLDRDVVIVNSKLKTGAANTQDVLDKIQGVQYDRYSDKIKVDNDENIIMLVDGLEKDPDYINNLDPERLQKVEIIRDPGGKYGLDGYTAVINVILKTNYRGQNIGLRNFMLIDPKTDDFQYLFPVRYHRASIESTLDKLNIYASGSMYSTDMLLNSTNKKTYQSNMVIENLPIDDDNKNITVHNMGDRYNLGFDYKINPKHTVSVEAHLGGLFNKDDHENRYKTVYSQNGEPTQTINLFTKTHGGNMRQRYSLYYIGKINTKMSVNFNASYRHSSGEFDNMFQVGTNKARREEGENTTQHIKLYSELNYDITPKSSMQLGYGFTDGNTKSESEMLSASDNEKSKKEFSNEDTRHRVYAYYAVNPNKKFGVKIGLATEFSHFSNDKYSDNFTGYQPYLNMKYVPFSFLNIRVKYRASSRFPRVSQTDPAEHIIDNQSVKVGNPNLNPSVNHRTSIRFNIMKGFASVEPYYNFSNNRIAEIARLRNDGIIEYSYDNVGNYNTKGVKLNISIPFGKSVVWQNNADIYQSQIKYQDIDNKVNDWKFNSQLVYMNRKYATTAGLTFQKSNVKRIQVDGYSSWNNDMWGVFVQKPFFKKRLNVVLGYVLPIDWGAKYYQDSYKETKIYTEISKKDISMIKNMLFCRISFRFNKGKTRSRVFKSEDEERENTGGGIQF